MQRYPLQQQTFPHPSHHIRVCICWQPGDWRLLGGEHCIICRHGKSWAWRKHEVQTWLQLDCEVVRHRDGLGPAEVVEEEDVGDVELAEEEAVVRGPQPHAGVPREQRRPRHRLLLLLGGDNVLPFIPVSLHRCQLQYCIVELFKMFPLWEINASWARKTWHGSLIQRREIITQS